MRKKDFTIKELKIIHRRLLVAMKGIEEGISLMEEINTPSVYVDESPANRVVTWANQIIAKAAMDPVDQKGDAPKNKKVRGGRG